MPQAYEFLQATDILSPSRDEAIGSSSPQITALQDTQMIEFIHWLNTEWVNAAHLKHHAGGWSFMKKTAAFSVYQHTSLSAAVSAGAATFVLTSATNWGTTGRSVIETNRGGMDFVDHTNKSSNTLTVSTVTGAETISIDHASGNRVHRLVPAPTDFGRVHQLWVNQRPFSEEHFTGMFPCANRFAVYGQYFLLPRGMATADGTLLYEKAPADISTAESETNIPRAFQRWAIYMTLHHLYMVRRKREDTLPCLQLAELELEKALMADSVGSSSTRIRLA